jgi:hypothetical protein
VGRACLAPQPDSVPSVARPFERSPSSPRDRTCAHRHGSLMYPTLRSHRGSQGMVRAPRQKTAFPCRLLWNARCNVRYAGVWPTMRRPRDSAPKRPI